MLYSRWHTDQINNNMNINTTILSENIQTHSVVLKRIHNMITYIKLRK